MASRQHAGVSAPGETGDVIWKTERLESVELPTDERVIVRVTRDRRDWRACRWE